MWTRKELKERASVRFKANYWKSVLAALILAIVVGGGSGGSGGRSNINFNSNPDTIEDIQEFSTNEIENPDELIEKIGELGNEIGSNKEVIGNQISEYVSNHKTELIMFGAVIGIMMIIIYAIALCISIFLFNPLEIGARNFFVKNLDETAELSCLGAGFSFGYKNKIKIMFLRDLYTWAWGLLLIIPGIIKKYEYRMIPYLLAENPEMTSKEAFAESKRMMTGNKWAAFVLDLSFLGWAILNVFTLGILGIFFVNPYKFETQAALYDVLKGSSNTFGSYPEYETYENYVEVE